MTLNSQFKLLCYRWREKAKEYNNADIHQLFDKFFTLYVVYNMLYSETAAYLHRKAISEEKQEYKLDCENFPDKNAATKYVLALLTSKGLMQSLESIDATKQAIDKLKTLIDRQRSPQFSICLDPVFGDEQENEDSKLMQMLYSQNTDERARAILEIIYHVRCNMFHGRKSVDPVQMELLIPLTLLLEKIIDKLYRKLDGLDYV